MKNTQLIINAFVKLFPSVSLVVIGLLKYNFVKLQRSLQLLFSEHHNNQH